jgi:hypothetical protein
MKLLELKDFENSIGTTFGFSREYDGAALSADLVLTSATPSKLSPRDMRAIDTSGKYRSQPFSLLFESEHTPYLPQGLYAINHPSFPDGLDMFITCLGPAESGKGYMYEAVFG